MKIAPVFPTTRGATGWFRQCCPMPPIKTPASIEHLVNLRVYQLDKDGEADESDPAETEFSRQ
jgi:hypothetical protein